MNTDFIQHKGLVLAMIVRGESEWDKGLNFISAESDFVQAGFWNYDKGKKLQAHLHLDCLRQVLKTQEVILVKRGKLRVDIYTPQKVLFQSIELIAGDIGIFLHGGHGYEILEDDTMVLEIKNGPYVGPENDRERI